MSRRASSTACAPLSGSTDANGMRTSEFAAAASAISSLRHRRPPRHGLGVDGEDDRSHLALAVVRRDVVHRGKRVLAEVPGGGRAPLGLQTVLAGSARPRRGCGRRSPRPLRDRSSPQLRASVLDDGRPSEPGSDEPVRPSPSSHTLVVSVSPGNSGAEKRTASLRIASGSSTPAASSTARPVNAIVQRPARSGREARPSARTRRPGGLRSGRRRHPRSARSGRAQSR